MTKELVVLNHSCPLLGWIAQRSGCSVMSNVIVFEDTLQLTQGEPSNGSLPTSPTRDMDQGAGPSQTGDN